MKEDYKSLPVVGKLSRGEETAWLNPNKVPFAKSSLEIGMADIDDAAARLERFAPFIKKCFPETEKDNGLIESALASIPKMKSRLEEMYGIRIPGRLLLR